MLEMLHRGHTLCGPSAVLQAPCAGALGTARLHLQTCFLQGVAGGISLEIYVGQTPDSEVPVAAAGTAFPALVGRWPLPASCSRARQCARAQLVLFAWQPSLDLRHKAAWLQLGPHLVPTAPPCPPDLPPRPQLEAGPLSIAERGAESRGQWIPTGHSEAG